MITSISKKNQMVSVDKLNVIFDKKHIIHDVSFSVNEGEIIGLFDFSGATYISFQCFLDFIIVSSIMFFLTKLFILSCKKRASNISRIFNLKIR